MKKILFIFLILCVGVIGLSNPGYSKEEIDFTRLGKGEKIISPAGLYDTGKAELNPQAADFLDKLGDFLKKNPGPVIEIGGHTDTSGSLPVNQKLSLLRAQKAKEYLVRRWNIPEERITCKGYASASPIADNDTPQGRARNRRIEISVVKAADPAGRLTYIRRDVFTKSPEKVEFIRATLNQGLFHLYRVLTRQKSNANVTFQDLSRINLGPQSLMIIYSLLDRELRLPRQQNVHLLTGGLRTKLNTLKGALQVETPSCVINSDSVEILVGIDEKKMSALSVYDGKSKVKAQGETVEVPQGYGTVVEMGAPPALPEPLPKAPQLIKPMRAEILLPGGLDTVPVPFQWLRTQDSASFHIQVAADSQFEKIIEDVILRDDAADLPLGAGTYHWRAAAINQRGIEGYASRSWFTVTAHKGLPELSFEITPGYKKVIETARQRLRFSGKTAPGTRVAIKGKIFSVNSRGAFAGSISLGKGWNHIEVRASHPGFKEKIVWLTIYRFSWCESILNIGFRVDQAIESKGSELDGSFTLQLGKSFCFNPHLVTELSAGLTKLGWKEFPGDYKKTTLAVPFTAELRFILGKGIVAPHLSGGVSAYLAFPEKQSGDTRDTRVFISPEFGGGFSFPISGMPVRIELKYSPFLKNEPFFPETVHRLALILKILL